MSKCKSCGAEIIWIKTANGKNMPIDFKPIRAYKQRVIVEINGHLIDGEWDLVECHIPHWGTCPTANKHKKSAVKGV